MGFLGSATSETLLCFVSFFFSFLFFGEKETPESVRHAAGLHPFFGQRRPERAQDLRLHGVAADSADQQPADVGS